jgi:hypothetical protein
VECAHSGISKKISKRRKGKNFGKNLDALKRGSIKCIRIKGMEANISRMFKRKRFLFKN